MRFLRRDDVRQDHRRRAPFTRRVLTSGRARISPHFGSLSLWYPFLWPAIFWLHVLRFLCIWSLGIGCATAQEAAATPAGLAAGYEELIVALNLNGQPAGDGVLALRDRTGAWWLPSEVLASAQVLTAGKTTLRSGELSYIPIESLRAQEATFNESRMTLAIRLPAESFRPNALGPVSSGDEKLTARPAGEFLNYELLLDQVAAHTGRSLYAEAGSAIGPGVGVINALIIDRAGFAQRLRLDTTYTLDLPQQMATLRAGDGVTHPSTILGRAVRFGGLQWGTNFLTRPGLLTVPVATLSGQAALPSTIDLYVNEVLQSRSAVPPGPFSIVSTPLVSGDGEVVLKVTDMTGQQQIVSQRFYASSALLAQGLTDYSVEVGALRRNYGLRSNDYGDLLIAGSWRHGLSNSVTAEAAASVQQGRLFGAEAGATAAFPGLGTGVAAIGISEAQEGPGAQLALGFERRAKTHSFSVRTQLASEHFRQAGVDVNQTLRRLMSLFYGYQIAGIGHIGLSYTRQQRSGAEPVAIATASLTPRQTPWGSFTLSLVQSRAERPDTSINLFWSMTLDSGASLSAFHARPSNAPAQSGVQWQSSPPPGEGWGYRLQAATNAANQAAVFGHNAFGAGRLEVAELSGQTSARAGVSGGLALLDGQMFATRRIDGSFGVVRMPGFAHVRVYVDNQLAGRTNDDGYALLPRLHPYLKNDVSIEQLDLPLDARLEQLRVHPVPGWRSGIVIDLPVRPAAAATMDLMSDDGKPVPAGAVVSLTRRARETGKAKDAQEATPAVDKEPEAETFVVGDDGLLYVAGLRAHNTLHARWPGGGCSAEVGYRPEKGTVPHLGRQVCDRQGGD